MHSYRQISKNIEKNIKLLKNLMSTKSDIKNNNYLNNCWQLNRYSNEFNESVITYNDECVTPVIHKPNQLLVKVLSASVNPIDIAMTSGYGSNLLSLLQMTNDLGIDAITYDRLPLVLGRDFSGIVVDCGQSVDEFKIGDSVWGTVSPFARSGSHSQLIVVDQNHIYRKPRNLSEVESASLPYVGLTSWAAISTFGFINESNAFGKRALVLGGSGGVGTFAIQLLKTFGCSVTTTCSSDAIDFIYTNTGADYCIDYNTNELESHLGSFDFVLNASTGNQNQEKTNEFAVKLLKKWNDSKYVTLSPPLLRNTDQFGLLFGTAFSAFQASKDTINGLRDGRSVRWAFYYPNQSALKSITHLVENCSIRPVIDKVFKFNDLPKAYRKVYEGHARGKTVIDFT